MTDIRKYNIYCDESNVDNKQNSYMVIGALFIDRAKIPEIRQKLNDIQEKYYIKGELKWVKTSGMTLDFYKDIFNYLFSLPDDLLDYRCIVVDKSKVNYVKYHKEDKELAFYKFYYNLLKRRLEQDREYYVFLDFRPSKNKNSVRRLYEFLSMFIMGYSGKTNIKHFQAYHSNENIFIQLADVLTGAVSYSVNQGGGSRNKLELIKIIAKSINKDNLNFCSNFWDKKFNIFCIDLGKNK